MRRHSTRPMAARLRKTFNYPDDDQDNTVVHLDEEEQEDLIAELQDQNANQNELYSRALTGVSLAAVPYYLFLILFSGTNTSATGRLWALLAITSLLATSYDVYYLSPGRRKLDKGKKPVRNIGVLGARANWRGPLEQYLPLTNRGLVVLLLLGSLRDYAKDNEHWLSWTLPALLSVFSSFGKRIIGEVDISELERLKYRYKGA